MSCETQVSEILPGFYCFRDSCNVYVVRGSSGCIAVDFGSGAWLEHFKEMDLPPLKHVFLTHHHADQCSGLLSGETWPFMVHAPPEEKRFLSPEKVAQFWGDRLGKGVPESYSVLPRGIAKVSYDMIPASGDVFWEGERIRFLSTPGHGAGAVSIIVDVGSKQVVFCGDAAHDGGTLHQPYCLEWDHYRGTGVLRAWEGVRELSDVGMDLLCPSHGGVISERPRQELCRLACRLMDFYQAKGSICPGERDRYVRPEVLSCGAREVLPRLYQFGENGYLLLSERGEGLVVDPTLRDMPALDELLDELSRPSLRVAVASHYHSDHTDAIPYLSSKYGTSSWLHPWVARRTREVSTPDVPWLPDVPIIPDHLWPVEGTWRWNEYEFHVAPFPGQTWWHCCFMSTVSGRKVLFGGDNFFVNSRWNGTGGFSSFNGSRFREGFMHSAQRVIDWEPDIIAAGHGTYFRYRRGHFRKIIRWAQRAEASVRALCPTGDLEKDYFLHAI